MMPPDQAGASEVIYRAQRQPRWLEEELHNPLIGADYGTWMPAFPYTISP